MPLIDRQIASWYTSTNPTSNFAQMLVCAMGRPEGERIMLLNHTFTRRKHAETLETRHLETKAELLKTLQAEFNITLPQDVNLGPPGSAWPTE
jgi:N-hydroxyarylamine O-acetyltransferase